MPAGNNGSYVMFFAAGATQKTLRIAESLCAMK